MTASRGRRGVAVPWLVIGITLIGLGVLGYLFMCPLRRSAEEQLVEAAFLGAPHPERMDVDRPECPHDWSTFPVADTVGGQIRLRQQQVMTGELVSGRQTNVPEFNDCQRFPVPDGTRFGPFMAVFASTAIERVMDSLGTLNPQPGLPVRGFSVAQVYRYPDLTGDPPEVPRMLGIEVHFNSLVMFPEGDSLGARMVPVGKHPGACLEVFSIADSLGTRLKVNRTLLEGFDAADLPPVARWEWDAEHGRPLVSIMCGPVMWCDIGEEPGAAPSYMSSSDGTAGMSRVLRIKGWYDEQELAVRDGETVKPGGVKGTIIPHPDLESRKLEEFRGAWIPVSYVAIQGSDAGLAFYKTKLNLDPAPVSTDTTRLNELSYCFGTRRECGFEELPPDVTLAVDGTVCERWRTRWCKFERRLWWSRIVSAKHRNVRYGCVVRRHHEEMEVPGTARWRWLNDDDTTWTACTNGCCEGQDSDGDS